MGAFILCVSVGTLWANLSPRLAGSKFGMEMAFSDCCCSENVAIRYESSNKQVGLFIAERINLFRGQHWTTSPRACIKSKNVLSGSNPNSVGNIVWSRFFQQRAVILAQNANHGKIESGLSNPYGRFAVINETYRYDAKLRRMTHRIREVGRNVFQQKPSPFDIQESIGATFGRFDALSHRLQLKAINDQDPDTNSNTNDSDNKTPFLVAVHWFFVELLGLFLIRGAGIFYGSYCILYGDQTVIALTYLISGVAIIGFCFYRGLGSGEW